MKEDIERLTFADIYGVLVMNLIADDKQNNGDMILAKFEKDPLYSTYLFSDKLDYNVQLNIYHDDVVDITNKPFLRYQFNNESTVDISFTLKCRTYDLITSHRYEMKDRFTIPMIIKSEIRSGVIQHLQRLLDTHYGLEIVNW
jgi:hypothetical protein